MVHRKRLRLRLGMRKWKWAPAPGGLGVLLRPGCVGRLAHVESITTELDWSAVSAAVDGHTQCSRGSTTRTAHELLSRREDSSPLRKHGLPRGVQRTHREFYVSGLDFFERPCSRTPDGPDAVAGCGCNVHRHITSLAKLASHHISRQLATHPITELYPKGTELRLPPPHSSLDLPVGCRDSNRAFNYSRLGMSCLLLSFLHQISLLSRLHCAHILQFYC